MNNAKMNKKREFNTKLTAQVVEFKIEQLYFSDFFYFEHGKLSLYYSSLPLL